MRTVYIFLFCFTGLVSQTYAQNNTSPYSIIGIGDIEKSSFDRTSGMGHAGLALSSNKYLFVSNPASYSTLDEHFFYIEVASRYKSVTYTGTPVTDFTQNRSDDVQFKKIALATKILPRWAISVGLLPYSTSNYSFNSTKTIQGSNLTTNAYNEGSGSTNQFYVANSFAISKNLSVGAQFSYLFGQLQEKETISSGIADSVLTTTRNIFLGKPFFKFGLQYRTQLSKKLGIAFGATISNQSKMTADYSLLVTDGNSVVINNEYYKTNYFTIPLTYSGGIAATVNNTYTFAADYHYEGWGSLNYKGINYSLVNSQRFSAGAEYSKKLSYYNQTFETYFFQMGGFYSDSYLRIAGQQLTDYGLTFGAGLQFARSDFRLAGAIELGIRGTTDYGLIKENYTQFNLSLSYRDFWRSKKFKKYD